MGNGHEPLTVTLEEGRASCFRRRRTRELRKLHQPAFTPRVQPIVSRRWSRSGRGASVLRLHRARRGAWAQAASRSWLHYMSGDFQSEIKGLGIEASPSFVREPEGNGVSRALHPTPEGRTLLLGADVQNHRGTAKVPSSSHSPGRYNESRLVVRAMDTKRPRGSERSKPCHELQLTRRSQPPYPGPPEQAQLGVSVNRAALHC